jgi:uncharacterized protein
VGIARLPDQLVTRDVHAEPRFPRGKPTNDNFTVQADIVTPPRRAELGLVLVRAPQSPPQSSRIDRVENLLGPGISIRIASDAGRAAFAETTLPPGSVVATFGGTAATFLGLAEFDAERISRSIQIDDDRFLVGPVTGEPGDFINHSCSPNCGMRNATQVVTMRRVDAGEPLTFDYAMTDTVPYDEFICRCGSDVCRGFVRATDWTDVDLQNRYGRWFAPHVTRRIEAQRRARRLTKVDVESLMNDYDTDTVGALTTALRIVTGRAFASWETLAGSLPDAADLLALNTASLDRLAAEMNETRSIDFHNGVPHPSHEA